MKAFTTCVSRMFTMQGTFRAHIDIDFLRLFLRLLLLYRFTDGIFMLQVVRAFQIRRRLIMAKDTDWHYAVSIQFCQWFKRIFHS